MEAILAKPYYLFSMSPRFARQVKAAADRANIAIELRPNFGGFQVYTFARDYHAAIELIASLRR